VTERAQALAKAYGIAPRIASRVEDVLEEIDGAVIATPNDSHGAIAVACLNAGVATLIEKPLASSYEAGLEIVRAGEHHGRVVAVGYSTRFRASISLLKHLLDASYFGAVQRFVHQFGTAGGWAPLSSYNLNRQIAGGGVLVVTGTHFLDRMLYFWGYPDDVALMDDSTGGPEANCVATFKYASSKTKFSGVVRYSKTGRLPGGLVIETDRGYVVLADDDEADIIFRPRSHATLEQIIRGVSRPAFQTVASVFQRQLEDFIQACRSGTSPTVNGRQGLESLRLIEDLYSCRRPYPTEYYPAKERHAHT
jgi:predicted dehydrogenase